MKRHIALILCIAFCMTLVTPINLRDAMAEGQNSVESIVIGGKEYKIRDVRVNTNFNDFANDIDGEEDPAPWKVDHRVKGQNNIIGEIPEDKKDKSAKFVTQGKGVGNLLLQRYFNTEASPPLRGKVLLEAKMCFQDKNLMRRLFILRDATGTLKNTIIADSDGKMKVDKQELFTYQIGKWYYVQMLLDIEKSKLELFIDDANKGCYDFDTGDAIQEVRFAQVVKDNTAGSMYLDDIKIIELEDKSDEEPPEESPIEDEVLVTGIILEPESLQLQERGTKQLMWVITPENATNKKVRFESQNQEIIQVQADGTVIGIKSGETVIKVITEDGNHESSCSVTVTPYVKDEFDQMREKWEQMILGTPYDAENQKIKEIISNNDDEAQSNWETMNKESNRTYLWQDLPCTNEDRSENIRFMYSRILTMTKSYKLQGSRYYDNQKLLNDIIDALDWLNNNHYYKGKQAYKNWWPWEIGIPKTLNDIVVLLYDKLSPIQIKNYMDAIEYFQPDPRYSGANAQGTTSPNKRESVGANRVDTCKVVAIRGCIIKDGYKIALSRDALSQVFEYVTKEDGFYRDGSFIQHKTIPYTGTYGNVLIGGVSDLLHFLYDTSWQVTDPKVDNIYKSVLYSFEPLLYKGAVMDMVSGRGLVRSEGDHGRGREIVNSIILLAQFVPEPYASYYKSLAKYMIVEDTFEPYFEKVGSILLYNLAKEIVDDPNIDIRESYIRHVQYPNMDRVVHHRSNYAFGISGHSKRVGNYETMNGENLKGWYTGDGMTYLYNRDLGHYTDYWPTVDPYRIPGTTEDTSIRENSSGERRFPKKAKGMSSKSWVGGALLNETYGIWGMEFESWDETLNARKSYFMFDDEIVLLGAGINSEKAGVSVETTIENRKLGKEGTDIIKLGYSQGEKTLEFGEEQHINGAIWAHLKGGVAGANIGYYFPHSENINTIKEKRKGSYKDIRDADSPDVLTNNYFTMCIDHGEKPKDAKYEYVLLPNKTLDETKKYAQNPGIVVLANNELAQGVKNTKLNIWGINFWTDTEQKVDMITSYNRAAVIVQENNGIFDIGISDPTMENCGVIELEIDQKADKILYNDPHVTVKEMKPKIKIQVDVKDAQGQTFSLKLQKEKPADIIIPVDPVVPEDPGSIWIPAKDITINGSGHVEGLSANADNIGQIKKDIFTIGTTGEKRRLEGFTLEFKGLPSDMMVVYRAHIQTYSDMPNKKYDIDYGIWKDDRGIWWKKQGFYLGTKGEKRRVEGIELMLIDKNTNKPYEGYSIEYQVHMQGYGWGIDNENNDLRDEGGINDSFDEWAKDGAFAGTRGEGRRIEAIRIRILKEEVK